MYMAHVQEINYLAISIFLGTLNVRGNPRANQEWGIQPKKKKKQQQQLLPLSSDYMQKQKDRSQHKCMFLLGIWVEIWQDEAI